MGVLWEQTEQNGRHNNLPASHHTHTHTHTHTHNGKRNGVFESREQHRLNITASNVQPHSRSLKNLPSEQRRASIVHPHSRSLQALPSEQRGAVHANNALRRIVEERTLPLKSDAS
jgi:hypothetical protein